MLLARNGRFSTRSPSYKAPSNLQHPQVCSMPTPVQATSQLRRRLSKSSVDELAAEKACEHWGEGKDDCVLDFLTTGDLEFTFYIMFD
jgi:hypothetical protein